ncbi:uncharacterized protein BDZ99DRAFT_494175 [Mytilinidion resinicola]|uniref:Uncharacterized protein n=1 Tax=Mytilinidion resinicola TaxID=574789 RepID=A0A6A6Z7T7_9PEZI|nr:uncharacterized protein BDZ99DRAFT_494175 [Mytilinidion resinicola]KAF2816335.1 hypothetical protein BDZ99DRAFT_494175 [Mytilinidion resinicola]
MHGCMEPMRRLVFDLSDGQARCRTPMMAAVAVEHPCESPGTSYKATHTAPLAVRQSPPRPSNLRSAVAPAPRSWAQLIDVRRRRDDDGQHGCKPGASGGMADVVSAERFRESSQAVLLNVPRFRLMQGGPSEEILLVIHLHVTPVCFIPPEWVTKEEMRLFLPGSVPAPLSFSIVPVFMDGWLVVLRY